MASVKKFSDAAVIYEIKHNKRELLNDKNTDIDPDLTCLNYSLTPIRPVSEYEYYLNRKAELYCFNRSDVKTLAGWIVTVPKELEKREDIDQFLSTTADFLIQRYGIKNTVSIECHFDEGKREKFRDRWTGEYIRDENGKVKTQLIHGRPHLHFLFLPVCPDNNPRHTQTEKICANNVLTPRELQHFHTDLRTYLNNHNCPGADGVINGSTKAQGRNYTVEELKERYETQKELERLREIERTYNRDHKRTRTPEKEGRWYI